MESKKFKQRIEQINDSVLNYLVERAISDGFMEKIKNENNR